MRWPSSCIARTASIAAVPSLQDARTDSRQMFDVAIQATIGTNIISRENVKALRKNVLAKCYGGDISRKKKIARKTKGRQKADETGGLGRDTTRSFLAILQVDDK